MRADLLDSFAIDPVYLLFTGMMKVKLLQTVSLVADAERASRSEIHLNGMAVVDDIQRRRLVIDLQDGQIRRLCVHVQPVGLNA